MAVSLNAQSSAAVSLGAVSSPQTFTNLTVAAGSNTVLMVSIVVNTAVTITSVTWAAQTLVQVGTTTTSGSQNLYIFAYTDIGAGPLTTGNQTLTVTWSGGASAFGCNAASFDNVDQTGGTTTFYNFNSALAGSGNPALTVTSTSANDACFECVSSTANINTPLQTTLGVNTAGTNAMGASYALGNGAFGFGWTGSGVWAEAGTPLKFFTAAGVTLMGAICM